MGTWAIHNSQFSKHNPYRVLLSILIVFPIGFISILLKDFCQETLVFLLRIPIMQHKTSRNRIRARNFTKQLFAQSTGKSIETKGSCTFLGPKSGKNGPNL